MNSFNITKILAANILVDALRNAQTGKNNMKDMFNAKLQDKLDAFYGTEDQEQANKEFDANDVVNSDTLTEEIAERMQESKDYSFMLVSKTSEAGLQAKDKIQAAFDRLRKHEHEPKKETEEFYAERVLEDEALTSYIVESICENKDYNFALLGDSAEACEAAEEKIQAEIKKLGISGTLFSSKTERVLVDKAANNTSNFAENEAGTEFYDELMSMLNELATKAQDDSGHAHKTADEIIDEQSEEITSLKKENLKQREELLKLRRMLDTIKGAL